MEPAARRSVILVGATDGLGLALAREYAGRGWNVCVVGRSAEKLERALAAIRERRAAGTGGQPEVHGVVCDVTDAASVHTAFEAALAALGKLDLLIYCAGVMPPAASVADRVEKALPTFDVNVVGAIRFLERAAAHLEPLGTGRLAAIGSTAGVRGRRGNPVYGASKAALHAYLEGLRHRLHAHHVGVSTIKPGRVRTRMLPPDTPAFPPAVSPERAARIIADALDRGADEFYVPWWWGPVALVLRLLPGGLHKRFAPA